MAPRLQFQFLRPYTCHTLASSTPARCSAYLRLYELAHAPARRVSKCGARSYATKQDVEEASSPEQRRVGGYITKHLDLEETISPEQSRASRNNRIKELEAADLLDYPRFKINGMPTNPADFRTMYGQASSAELEKVSGRLGIVGRITGIRRLSSNFSFVDIAHDGHGIQIMVNFKKLPPSTSMKTMQRLLTRLQRGDHICVVGSPALSDHGKLCLLAKELPILYAPSLVPLPFKVSPEVATHSRHMDLLVNRSSREILLLRNHLMCHLRAHLSKVLKCIEVQTPILAANAGGAMARPFTTHASEFPEKELALRIAPELWLKRLAVAGFDRVYEIGPSFRNEGVDATHNPEFTTCEFYLSHTNLTALLNITQNIFYGLAKTIDKYRSSKFYNLNLPDPKIFDGSFDVVEFIPRIEHALGKKLPDLESATAVPDLIALLNEAGKDWHRALPPNPPLPKLLDTIGAAVIEPLSESRPLFITYHPVCMSPLSKSFKCPRTGQHVAARAELFYNGTELANMYEEENDPLAQRAKFVAQAEARLARLRAGNESPDDDPAHVIDEQYLSVLESGLPPTAGWGAGIDRLVMLFSGAKRICDVQPFGNLRHVVGLASVGAPKSALPRASVDPARETVKEAEKAAKEDAEKRKQTQAREEAPWKGDSEREDGETGADVDAEVSEILYQNQGPKVVEGGGPEKRV